MPDNVYGDVTPTEAWRQQERDIRRDQREEASARALEPEAPPRPESPEPEDEPMDIDSVR